MPLTPTAQQGLLSSTPKACYSSSPDLEQDKLLRSLSEYFISLLIKECVLIKPWCILTKYIGFVYSSYTVHINEYKKAGRLVFVLNFLFWI